MRAIRSAALGFGLLFSVLAAHAFNTGNDLLEALQDNSMDVATLVFVKASYAGLLGGYELAKTDSIGSLETEAVSRAIGICPSPGVKVGQIKDVLTEFLVTNPAKRHQGAIFLLTAALREAFPCRN